MAEVWPRCGRGIEMWPRCGREAAERRPRDARENERKPPPPVPSRPGGEYSDGTNLERVSSFAAASPPSPPSAAGRASARQAGEMPTASAVRLVDFGGATWRGLAEMQPRCSRGLAEMQPRSSRYL